MDNEDFMGLNFWPAFTDSMLAIVLILLLVIGSFYIVTIQENQNIAAARKCQQSLTDGLDKRYSIIPATMTKATPALAFPIKVFDRRSGKAAMSFDEDPQDKLLLHISFMDFVLFGDDRSDLNDNGRTILQMVGGRIKDQIDSIVEIQIKGHADSRASKRFHTNLQLASERANEVFLFLQREVGIDPAAHAMSASSYGEFFPVGRQHGQKFGNDELVAANSTKEQMQANRRIELVLLYGGSMQVCHVSPQAK